MMYLQSQVGPPAASMSSCREMPTGTRSVTGFFTAPPTVTYFSVTFLPSSAAAIFVSVLTLHTTAPTSSGRPPVGTTRPRDLVDDLLLIARRIIALQQMQLHIVRVLQHFLQGGDGSVVMLLQADDRALRTGEFLHGADAAHDIGCEILHDLLVDPQQRLTLGSVCKDEFGLAVDLYMGGKARAARAENTGVADQFIQLHPVRLR